MHAMADLLPRALFEKRPELFRMNDAGDRVPDANLCVSAPAAVEVVCENTVAYAKRLRPSTGRHYFWIDDGQPMCRCPKCRGLSESDQALLLENAVLAALRRADPKATLAHLCYANTLKPPTSVKPESGIFLEFAPIQRRSDRPLNDPGIPAHVEALATLDANLAVFGRERAQALEYWLDVSRFSGWKRESLTKIPWDAAVVRNDIQCYAAHGVRHVTNFAVWLDGEYAKRFGDPPLKEYAAAFPA